MLFVKWNGQIVEGLSYKGNNTFASGSDVKAIFEILPGGSVKVKVDYSASVGDAANQIEGVKTFKY